MPRKVRDASLETRTARHRLAVRHKPYFRLIEPGLHIGYRRVANGPGAWIVRRYATEGRYAVENLRTADGNLVLADDYAEADGERILTFAQAQERARVRPLARSQRPYTVADAMADYLAFLESDGRSKRTISDTRCRSEAFIAPKLGNTKLVDVTADGLRRWRDELVKMAPRLRTRKGSKQQYREPPRDEDARRSRRASANRTWTILRAALNHAFREGRVENDLAWRAVKPFRNVDAARIRYLTVTEAARLINAADLDFRPLVEAALQTGCRYGELLRMQCQDFNRDSGTVAVRQSKTGKPRHVVLTTEGVAFFTALCNGQVGNQPMFCKRDGSSWGPAHQARPMKEAVSRAKITPAISFHGLRHTWASLSVMAGMPLMVVGRNLGHVDTRMVEKHYGHLAPSYVADTVRAMAPQFGNPVPTLNK